MINVSEKNPWLGMAGAAAYYAYHALAKPKPIEPIPILAVYATTRVTLWPGGGNYRP